MNNRSSRARRIWVGILVLLIAVVVLALVFQFRFLLLSKLNINSPGATDAGLGLRQIAEIPLPDGTLRFDYQSIDGSRGQLFIAHLGASHVVVFDLKSQQIVANIADVRGVHGLIAVPELHRVYASATGANQVAVIDEDSFQVIARIEGGNYPDGLAYDPENGRVFVSDEVGGTDTVIDARTNARIATIDLGGEAGNTQYDPVSRRIFTAVHSPAKIAVIDPKTNSIVSRVEVSGCVEPHGLYINSVARTAYIACQGNATLLVLDLQTLRVVGTQTIGEIPDVLAFDKDLQRLYIASESGVVSIFQERGGSLEKLGQAFLAPNAHTIAVDSQTHRVYLPLENINGRAMLRVFEPASSQ